MHKVAFGVRITRSLKTPRTYAAAGPGIYGGKPYPPEPEITRYEKVDWSIVKNVVLECDRLGYDLITVPDHMILGRDRLEAWTTLSALSSITTRLRLGTMVLCNEYRHPSVLAKMGATLDFISSGRLDFGIGAGYQKEEFEAYGIPFLPASVRIKRLGEAVRIIKKMWTEEAPSYIGEYYSIKEAVCEPKPIQKPHPPITIGGSGDKLLRVSAEFADSVNFIDATVERYRERLSILEKHCSRIGRDFDEIEKTWGPWFWIYADENEFKEKADESAQRLLKEHEVFMGTPKQIIDGIQSFVDIGVTKFQLLFVDLPSLRGIRLFASEVMPHFQ